jgi:hypothetical protein
VGVIVEAILGVILKALVEGLTIEFREDVEAR